MCKALQPLKAERIVTWDELSSHNTSSDLWVAVNGRAYDLTAYQTAHPGGALILQHHAGRDASEAWVAYAHNSVPGMRQLHAHAPGWRHGDANGGAAVEGGAEAAARA